MNSYPGSDGVNMGGANQFPGMGGFGTGFTQFGQNNPMGQPGISAGFPNNQMPFMNMYQPQQPKSQQELGCTNEEYQQYICKLKRHVLFLA